MNVASPETAAEATLRLAYDDRVHEAARLRDARRAFTTQLGVLPASAAVVVAAFGAFSESIDVNLLAIALVPFIVAVGIGAFYGRHEPYRSIRKRVEEEEERIDWLELSPNQWLVTRIRHEAQIYRELEQKMQRERRGVQVVQLFVVAQIVYVIVLAAW
jgi:hypothetical protein